MRPDAAAFSPCNGTITSFDPYAAVDAHALAILSASENLSDTTSTKSTKESPHDMIMHESVKRILKKIADLEVRCIGLETANKELQSEIAVLKADRDVNGGHYDVNGTQCATNGTYHSVNGNLTGYESSSNGSERDFTVSSGSTAMSHPLIRNADVVIAAQQSSVDLHELRSKIGMISEVLGDHEKRIAQQSTRTYELDQSFQRKDKTSTWLQGRIGKLEKDFKGLDSKVDEIEVDSNRGRSLSKTGGSADVGAYLMDEVQQMQMRLADLTTSCQKGYEELEGKCTALATVVEGGSSETVGRVEQWQTLANNSNKDDRKASKKDVADLKQWQYDVRRMSKNKQVIDEASTRDALDAMFFQLTSLMGRSSGDAIWLEGPFETTTEEAFQLRDRVLCRLALFDPYATALKEVQAKKGQVDW